MRRDRATGEFRAQIVYAGPGLSGKTTNLEFVSERLEGSDLRGVNTQGERTLVMDLTTADYGVIDGSRVRFHLATVPGQAQYRKARSIVLKRPDAVIFVADSRPDRFEANRWAMEDLRRIFEINQLSDSDIPLVMQWNKRDLADAMAIDRMRSALNLAGATEVAASAINGVGVFKTLRIAMDQAVARMQDVVPASV